MTIGEKALFIITISPLPFAVSRFTTNLKQITTLKYFTYGRKSI